MPTALERDLGLYAVVTISIGAMVGSGIFVLPGLAFHIAGPAVVLAYLLAGLVVLPAALSKAEMGTAMPEAGGTYLYIDRAMGPFFGTIAGIGAWFSLTFKSAFALVGLGAYLVLLVSLSQAGVTAVALVLGVALVLVNVLGVKQTGRVQATIVTLVLLVLVVYVADGLTYVQAARYHPFFGAGPTSLLEATGFVFVSYAGVTKIASVAEEVENPGRNLPAGILISLVTMMAVYTLIVYVLVGVSDPSSLGGSLTPMYVAAERFLGSIGDVVIVGVAVLALTSMANAGVLSSSRYPFAMSRDSLAPASLARVSERFGTPVVAIAFTGVILLALVAFVPVFDLAKLASAFQILVFTLINVALVAFRESDLESYAPSFVAPGYPWVQLFGIVGGLVLLTQMGSLPLAGAVGIVAVGVAWYRLYGREQTDREGAALDAFRRRADQLRLQQTEAALASDGGVHILVPMAAGTDPAAERTRLGVAASLVRARGGRIQVVRFEPVPEQTPLSPLLAEHTPAEVSFETATAELAADLGVAVEAVEVATHDVRRATVNFAVREDVDLILSHWDGEGGEHRRLGHGADWLLEDAPCDVVFVEDRGLGSLEEIAVLADVGPYDPLKLALADALAGDAGGRLRFVNALGPDVTAAQLDSVRAYHDALDGVCSVPTKSEILRTDRAAVALAATLDTADLVVMGAAAQRHLAELLFGSLEDRLVSGVASTVLLVHAARPRTHTFLRGLFERLVYRT